MSDDQRNAALQQLANIVIDAYLSQDEQFTPTFEDGTESIMYLVPPEGDKDHPRLKTHVWYDRSDYEAVGIRRGQNAKATSKK